MGWACPRCGTAHPTVDHIPLVLSDLPTWIRQEALSLLCRQDLDPDVVDRIASDVGGPLRRDLDLLKTYGGSPASPLTDWVRERSTGLPGPVLDLGCGLGYGPLQDGVGLDLNFSLLRHHPGPAVLADASDPPFEDATFGSVRLLNLLDSCRDPLSVLTRADALLRPGGTLVLTCPFAWQPAITPRERWMDPPLVLDGLTGRAPGSWFRYEVLEQGERDWTLQAGPRTLHVHRTWVLVARKGT